MPRCDMMWIFQHGLFLASVLGLLSFPLLHAQTQPPLPPRLVLACEEERAKSLEYVQAMAIQAVRQEAMVQHLTQELIKMSQERDAAVAKVGTAHEARPDGQLLPRDGVKP